MATTLSLYLLLVNRNSMKEIGEAIINNNFNKVATESAQKNINLETFKDINLMMPNYETQKKFPQFSTKLKHQQA